MLYPWLKALHVISVICWMAGLLYLPRLFVYHASVEQGSQASDLFKVMERRLLRAIMNPAMIASYVFGVWMLWLNPDLLHVPYMHVKFAAVLLLTLSHMSMARCRRAFAEDRNPHKAVYFRILNEIPTLLMIVIVIMVVVRPEF
jgi:putative membrane protein